MDTDINIAKRRCRLLRNTVAAASNELDSSKMTTNVWNEEKLIALYILFYVRWHT